MKNKTLLINEINDYLILYHLYLYTLIFKLGTELFTAITPSELTNMCLSQAYERSEQHLLTAIGEYK